MWIESMIEVDKNVGFPTFIMYPNYEPDLERPCFLFLPEPYSNSQIIHYKVPQNYLKKWLYSAMLILFQL